MGMVYFIFCAFRKCLDFVCLLVDVNFWLISTAVRLLSGLLALLHALPLLISSSAAGCWNLTLFCVLAVSEGVTSAAQGSLQVLSGWLQALGGVSESFKMLGHLMSHVLLRTRELVHRGLLSGHSVLRQACEGCTIVLSLLLYLVNTVVNMLLIGVQNCFAAVAGAWEAVSGPLQEALELSLTLLTFLHSSLVGTSVLLWTPCQLALELLTSLGRVLAAVVFFNAYSLLLALAVVTVATVYLTPGLSHHGLRRVSDMPSVQHLQRALYRLYLVALERAQSALEVAAWQRTAWPASQQGARTLPQPLEGDQGGDRHGRDPLYPVPGDDLVAHPQYLLDQPRDNSSERTERTLLDLTPPDSAAGPPSTDGPPGGQKPSPDLLTLLKEHEERKKCVICQDRAKTVLLLPCRHLCLCRACADILLHQAAHQHSCPLCRHSILHTMDVYL